MKRKKVAIFHCSFIYKGGGERIVMEEVLGLRRRGYEVSCFTPILDEKACFPDLIGKIGVRTFLPQLPSWVPFRYAASLLLSSILAPLLAFKFRDVDIFIGANQPTAWIAFCMARVLGKPYIVYLNHPNRLLYPRAKEQWETVPDFGLLARLVRALRIVVSPFDRISITSARKVLINGLKFIGREISRAYGVSWIACPSGTWALSSGAIAKRANGVFHGTINFKGLSIKKPFLLFTGRHEAWKRIDLAIKAMPKVLNRFPQVTLVIPGEFVPETGRLQKLAENLGVRERVLFPGKITQRELETLYKEAAVFVFPSEKEDFGVVILEAMGSGLPVIAWRRGGPTDTVMSRVTGFLVKPYDLEEFAQRIIFLLSHPKVAETMGRTGWERTKNKFSWENHLDIFEKSILQFV